MLAVIGAIAAVLLALVAAGLLVSLIVKLTTTVGKYIMEKIRKCKKKAAVAGMGRIIDEINKQANERQREGIKQQLSAEDILSWMEDENGKVDEDSIDIIKEEQVDQKTRDLLKAHDDFFIIAPTAV